MGGNRIFAHLCCYTSQCVSQCLPATLNQITSEDCVSRRAVLGRRRVRTLAGDHFLDLWLEEREIIFTLQGQEYPLLRSADDFSFLVPMQDNPMCASHSTDDRNWPFILVKRTRLPARQQRTSVLFNDKARFKLSSYSIRMLK